MPLLSGAERRARIGFRRNRGTRRLGERPALDACRMSNARRRRRAASIAARSAGAARAALRRHAQLSKAVAARAFARKAGRGLSRSFLRATRASRIDRMLHNYEQPLFKWIASAAKSYVLIFTNILLAVAARWAAA